MARAVSQHLGELQPGRGSGNTALGNRAGYNLTTGANNVDVANQGVANDAAKIRIGTPGTQTAAFLAGVSGVSIAGPAQTVLINSSGQLGTATTASGARAGDSVARSAAHALGMRLRKTNTLVRRQQEQIDQLTTEVAQLRAAMLQRH